MTTLTPTSRQEADTVTIGHKVSPFLWFDSNAEEAILFYTSIFKPSKIGNMFRHGEGGPGPKDTLMSGTFEIAGQEFMALNGGPMFKFTPAVSFFVTCTSQAEIDELWVKLSAGGATNRCGWLQDKFGLSWQIIPDVLGRLLYSKDPVRSKQALAAMLRMTKLDIAELQRAYDEG